MNVSESIPAVQAARIWRSTWSRVKRRVLILGAGQLATDFAEHCCLKRTGMDEVIGFLDRDPGRVGERLVNPWIIGTYEQLFEIVVRHKIQTIAVCLEDGRAALPVQTLLEFKAMGLEVVDGHYYVRGRIWASFHRLAPSHRAYFLDRISSSNHGDGLEASVGYIGGMADMTSFRYSYRWTSQDIAKKASRTLGWNSDAGIILAQVQMEYVPYFL